MKHKYKYGILAAALASALFGAPSFAASTSTSTSGSTASGTGTGIGIGGGNAQSNSVSGSYSGSSAVGSLGQGGSATANGTGGTGGAAGSIVNFTYNDPAPTGDPTQTENLVTSGTQRIITTGQAIAPSIYSNNVCALSASAAGGFLGGAFALGFDRVDKGCDIRANASLLGHFAEIYSIAAEHAADPQVRQLAAQQAAIYAMWASNYICMNNPDMAASAPPDAHFCHTVATQGGLQVVPSPVAYTPPPRPQPVATTIPRPIIAAADPPPPQKPIRAYEAVSTSVRTGPINGYNGPDYSDDFKD